MCQLAIPTMYELDHWGVPFSRFPGGVIAQRPFGGAGYPRTCYAADRTGQMLLHTLYEQAVRKNVTFYDEWLVASLVVRDGKCLGLVASDLANGKIIPLQAKAVIFGTGGYGRFWFKDGGWTQNNAGVWGSPNAADGKATIDELFWINGGGRPNQYIPYRVFTDAGAITPAVLADLQANGYNSQPYLAGMVGGGYVSVRVFTKWMDWKVAREGGGLL